MLKKVKNVHEQNFYVEANNNKKVVMLDKEKYRYSTNQLIK